MLIKLRRMQGEDVDVNIPFNEGNIPIYRLREIVGQELQISDLSSLRLIHAGRVLPDFENNQTFHYNLSDGAVIHVVIRPQTPVANNQSQSSYAAPTGINSSDVNNSAGPQSQSMINQLPQGPLMFNFIPNVIPAGLPPNVQFQFIPNQNTTIPQRRIVGDSSFLSLIESSTASLRTIASTLNNPTLRDGIVPIASEFSTERNLNITLNNLSLVLQGITMNIMSQNFRTTSGSHQAVNSSENRINSLQELQNIGSILRNLSTCTLRMAESIDGLRIDTSLVNHPASAENLTPNSSIPAQAIPQRNVYVQPTTRIIRVATSGTVAPNSTHSNQTEGFSSQPNINSSTSSDGANIPTPTENPATINSHTPTTETSSGTDSNFPGSSSRDSSGPAATVSAVSVVFDADGNIQSTNRLPAEFLQGIASSFEEAFSRALQDTQESNIGNQGLEQSLGIGMMLQNALSGSSRMGNPSVNINSNTAAEEDDGIPPLIPANSDDSDDD